MIEIVSVEKKAEKKRISFAISKSTYMKLEGLKQRIQNQPEARLHLDEAMDEQLVKLIQKANQQLDKLTREPGPQNGQ